MNEELVILEVMFCHIVINSLYLFSYDISRRAHEEKMAETLVPAVPLNIIMLNVFFLWTTDYVPAQIVLDVENHRCLCKYLSGAKIKL